MPRIYFEGNNVDNDALQDLLDLLQITCVDPDQREERWAVVRSASPATPLEPAVALRVFRREAAEYYGLRSRVANRTVRGRHRRRRASCAACSRRTATRTRTS